MSLPHLHPIRQVSDEQPRRKWGKIIYLELGQLERGMGKSSSFNKIMVHGKSFLITKT